jgi:hypothetical protein
MSEMGRYIMESQKPPANSSGDENREDRRQHHQIRDIFEEAYQIVLPFIDPKQGWGGQAMTRHAYPALMEAFPALTMQDLASFVPALERVFKERSKPGN